MIIALFGLLGFRQVFLFQTTLGRMIVAFISVILHTSGRIKRKRRLDFAIILRSACRSYRSNRAYRADFHRNYKNCLLKAYRQKAAKL